MKTSLLTTAIVGLTISILPAQTVPFPETEVTDNTVPTGEVLDSVFANLDLSDITTGLLYDRGWRLTDPSGFDGSTTADTLRSYNQWLHAYGSMATAAIAPPGPIPYITTWNDQLDTVLEAGINPLVIMHADYHRIKRDSALIHSLMYSQNNQLFDYPGQSVSPYEQRTTFAFSPAVTTIYDSLSMDFKTSPAFYHSNTGQGIATLEVDFDNGNGYQNVGASSVVNASWTKFGEKTLKLKITYTDSQVFYAKSKLRLKKSKHYRPPGSKYSAYRDREVFISHPDPALAEYTADVEIEYGCGNDELIKPFIYVEGFSPEQFDGIENKTYFNFYEDFNDYQDFNSGGYPMLDELDANNFDIVYVDFAQGTGDILENAEVLKEVVRWVNAEKEANSSTENNLVAGFSMGGLIAWATQHARQKTEPKTDLIKRLNTGYP